MPRGDQTGPEGMGPRTGRGAGYCSGYEMPGYANPAAFRCGMGWQNRGIHGSRARHYGPGGHGFGWMRYAAFEVPYPENITPEEKMDMLKTRETWLQEQLEEVRSEMSASQVNSK